MAGEIAFWAVLALAFAAVIVFARPQKGANLGLSDSTLLAAAAPPDLSLAQLARDFASDISGERQITQLAAAAGQNKHVVRYLAAAVAAASVKELTEDQFEELFQLAGRDPKAALARIDRMPTAERNNPLIRFVRIFALGNLIWTGYDEKEGTQAFFRNLSREKVNYAEEGVKEIAAIERAVPDYFQRVNVEPLINRVCGPHEFHRAGGVQRLLGWTKLFYFLTTDRYYVLDPNDPDTLELKDLPVGALVNLLQARVTAKRTIMSCCMLAARQSASGWIGIFVVCAKTGGKGTKIRDLDPIGTMALREDGQWNFEEWHPNTQASAAERETTFATRAELKRVEDQLARLMEKLDARQA